MLAAGRSESLADRQPPGRTGGAAVHEKEQGSADVTTKEGASKEGTSKDRDSASKDGPLVMVDDLTPWVYWGKGPWQVWYQSSL